MSYIIVGLGNPGHEYDNTRHNIGRMIVFNIGKLFDAEWKKDSLLNADIAKVKISGKPVTLVLPNTFMNNSGKSLKQFLGSSTSSKAVAGKVEKMLVIYDDLDLPIGKVKMSFNKSSGGHRGLESIIKAVKTEKFPRIRVGISPTTPSGKLKKPAGEEKVMKHILGKMKPDELLFIKKISKKIAEALENFVQNGLEKTMSEFN